ncbi:3-phosphoshikimate 1-carboxyvinyltransferase [Neptunicella sp. SCSIO 80796]|uniref:3-phosphoshikimate 1-carboxyvinyltransferase n=1 Tax=Neptunicella plasticusilytica TaxID=3117012 RepID=UPI003A4D353A
MRKVLKTAIQDDPQISNLLERMPDDVSQSFSEKQLTCLKVALASRQWGQHKIDLRGTFKWFHYRYYFVVLAGKNRRELSAREQELSQWIKALIVGGFILFSWALGLLSLYLLKSALGINLFGDFSLGIWDWFKALFA